MSGPRYYMIIRGKEAQQQVLEDAYRVGSVSEDEYMFLMQMVPEELSEHDVARSLEIMRRIGILGRLDYS